MSKEQIYAEFDKWWHAPEQHELRISCAKGWGFRIWQASRAALVVDLTDKSPFFLIPSDPSPQDYIEAGVRWVRVRVETAGITVKDAQNRNTAAIISIKTYKRVNGKENGSQFD